MSRVPDTLDPATLRWVADDLIVSATRLDTRARWFRKQNRNADDVASANLDESHAQRHRFRAQKLRSLATRIERRRAKGGAR